MLRKKCLKKVCGSFESTICTSCLRPDCRDVATEGGGGGGLVLQQDYRGKQQNRSCTKFFKKIVVYERRYIVKCSATIVTKTQNRIEGHKTSKQNGQVSFHFFMINLDVQCSV